MAYKESYTRSMTGVLDLQSSPDQMIPGSFRFRQNWSCNKDGRVCRRRGWSKLLDGNSDYHDQLLPLQLYYDEKSPEVAKSDEISVYPDATKCSTTLKTRANGREIVTFGSEFKTVAGTRRLVIGTQSRLAVLNASTNNYRLIGDGFGGNYDPSLRRRWYADKLKNTVIFTNNYDAPVSWEIDDQAKGCAMRSVKKIKDLEAIKLTAAACVVEFSGAILLGNVVMDGQRLANRIVWSDFGDGTSFDPGAALSSLAGYQGLEDGEVILEMKKLGNQLYVYTQTSIYLGMTTASPDGAFSFQKVYKGHHALKYRNTLVDTGIFHYYAGVDGLYKWNPYQLEPELADWTQKSIGLVFDNGSHQPVPGYLKINKSCCDSHIAGFDQNTQELFFSWAEIGSCVPTKTIVFNMQHELVDHIDHGFSMFTNYILDDRPSLRDFMLSTCACANTDLKSLGLGFVKEGKPSFTCPHEPEGFIPNSIYTPQAKYSNGAIVENWEVENADENSLCAYLAGQFLEDFCNKCDTDNIFIGASTTDWCLKDMSADVLSREMCTNSATATGTGTAYALNSDMEYTAFVGDYSLVGYYSILRSAPDALDDPAFEKNLKHFLIELSAEEQTSPCVISLRIGRSYSALDPNSQQCSIQWRGPWNRYLVCPNKLSAEEYDARNLVPNEGVEWPVFISARYLYYELTIASLSNPDDLKSALLPAIGGASCYSGIRATMRQIRGISK